MNEQLVKQVFQLDLGKSYQHSIFGNNQLITATFLIRPAQQNKPKRNKFRLVPQSARVNKAVFS